MKKIIIFLLSFCIVSPVFSAEYTFYNPIVEKLSIPDSSFSEHVGVSQVSHYADISQSVCFFPEKDGKIFEEAMEYVIDSAHYEEETFKMILQEKEQSPKWKYPIFAHMISPVFFKIAITHPLLAGKNCASLDFLWYGRDEFMKNIQSRDELVWYIQYPQNATLFSIFWWDDSVVNFLSDKIFPKITRIENNYASFSFLEKLEIGTNFLCFGADDCEIEFMEIELLNGEKRDYTEVARKFKKNDKNHIFAIMDREYISMPKDTMSVKIIYK